MDNLLESDPFFGLLNKVG